MSVSFDPMTITLPEDIESVVLRPGPPSYRYSDEEFARLCARYPDLRIEMNSAGEMIVMPPVVAKGGRRNFTLTGRFGVWVEKDGTGVGFDSSTGFTLPNGAKRSPDVSWIRRERWDALTDEQKNQFAPICPDFVVELRSKSDRLSSLQEKMEEYISNGAQLGWLIDPLEKKVHIYRPGLEAQVIANPSKISGEGSLRSFTLYLDGIID
ncbi:MAG TPA: Uma2 family endonuclease [Blastocatellia bacterium]|jgi:Uma2 family endonuclease